MELFDAQALARSYGQRVFRFAYARLRNYADAEDVTQETFLRLVRAAPDFPDESRARAWLFQVAANCAADLCRLPWRRHEVGTDCLEETTVYVPEEDGALAAVLRLPKKYRAVIHLFYYEKESVAEISEILKLSQGAVKTRLFRGRALLRELLKEDEEYV